MKIDEKRLRQIVTEELTALNEAVDHEAAAKVSRSASALLKAVEKFKEAAGDGATAAVQSHLVALEGTLENMVSAPTSYVPKVKQEPKRVQLRKVAEGVNPDSELVIRANGVLRKMRADAKMVADMLEKAQAGDEMAARLLEDELDTISEFYHDD